MAEFSNRFSNQDLLISQDVSDKLSDFVSRSDKDPRPFSRQVDAWWLAVGIGLKMGLRTPLSSETVKFNDGGILGSDPWRITHLEALALAEEGVEVSPGQAIRLASEYANTGFLWLFEELLGEAEPTLTLMNKLSVHLQD